MKPAVAVDVGGTKTIAALVSPDGVMTGQVAGDTPARQGPDAVLDTIAELVSQVGGDDFTQLAGIGIGTAGGVDASNGTIISSTDTFTDWVGTDLRSGLATRLGLDPRRISVLNDVDAHACGEAWRGAARGVSSAIMVAVGTGVGGAVIIDNQVWTGAHHLAGEIGHLPTPGAEGLRCPCGRDGHLEALASGTAIARRYHEVTGRALDTREIVARASAGEEEASRVVAEAARGLGLALAGLIATLDPAAIIVGGGVAEAGPVWWDPLVESCRASLVTAHADLPILPAALGPRAALIGAAWMVFNQQAHPDEPTS